MPANPVFGSFFRARKARNGGPSIPAIATLTAAVGGRKNPAATPRAMITRAIVEVPTLLRRSSISTLLSCQN